MKNPKSFVIIPAYNEAPRIKQVIAGVQKFTRHIVVVDDGSSDETAEVARRMKTTVLRHPINLGKGAALKTGVEAVGLLDAEALVLMDADGQHDPKHIPEFLKKINQGFDIVFGARRFSPGVPLIRSLGNKFGSFLIRLIFGISRNDMLCGFIAFTPEIYQKIKWDSSRYGVETEIVARTGKYKLKYTEIPIETIYIDKYKGMTILDTFGILFNIPRWFFS